MEQEEQQRSGRRGFLRALLAGSAAALAALWGSVPGRRVDPRPGGPREVDLWEADLDRPNDLAG